MYLTLPSELVTDTFFPFEKTGELVKVRLQGHSMVVAKVSEVDVLSHLDQFVKAGKEKFGDADVWDYGMNLNVRQLLPFLQADALEETGSDHKSAVMESIGWTLNAANFALISNNMPSPLVAYLYEDVRFALSKYNAEGSSLRSAINDSLHYFRSLALHDFTTYRTSQFIPKEDLSFHHAWVKDIAEDIEVEGEMLLPEEVYHATQFVLVTGVSLSCGSNVRGWLTRTEVDPIGGTITRFNLKVSEALLYSVRVLSEKKKLTKTTAPTPRALNPVEVIAKGMLELNL